MYNYIPHPSNSRQASGLITLRIEEGAAGYGIYWMILELLRDSPDYKMGDNYKAIAFAINEPDTALVQRVCHNFGLFDFDSSGLMFSPWLSSQMESYDSRKKKLQEAGRRGAAKRFNTSGDGQAIATPSAEDGQAIAILPNITQPNITQPNISQPTQANAWEWKEICRNQGEKLTAEDLETFCKDNPDGHCPGYIAQVCYHYGIGKNAYYGLIDATDNANLSNPTYKKFCTLVKRIQAEKYRPEYPANFFFSKILKK